MGFKQDEDFLRFITMGAAGTASVSGDLRDKYGHAPAELERYAMANKLWTTKIKRLRLADLVCLDCGRRVEARAKSDLKVRMSHSYAPGRQWDAGLRDDDLCAFVPWADDEVAGSPAYFTVGDMRAAAKYAKFGSPKAASQGAERDVIWPMRVATCHGHVERVDHRRGVVTVRPDAGRRRTIRMPADVETSIYVSEGAEVVAGTTFVMGCLDLPRDLGCTGSTWDIETDLHDLDASTRYAAVKAAGERRETELESDLRRIAEDCGEDDRIRLEAWASLARLDAPRYTARVAGQVGQRASGDPHARAMAMEAIFILSELRSAEAAGALMALAADRNLDSEARCAAVWGLGTTGVDDPERVLAFIADDDEEVAIHAIAGVDRLPGDLIARVARGLGGSDTEAASAAAVLAKQGSEGARVLLRHARGAGRAATWALAALGDMPEADVRAAAETKLDAGLVDRLAPMWAARGSWLRRQEMDTPLRFVERQTIRHLV